MFPCVVYGLKMRVSKYLGSIGKSSDDVLRRWPDLPTHHGGVHDIVMWYYVVNARDALCRCGHGYWHLDFYFIGNYLLHYEKHVVMKTHNDG
jgi:hypothetical protein